jgi:hypothetical protein
MIEDVGFLDDGGGIGGFFPIGGGGLGLETAISGVECEAWGDGRKEFLSADTLPGSGGAAPGGRCGAPGGLGAAPPGGGGAAALGGGVDTLRDVCSGSESYAPVLTPPDFLNLGMPPANNPPNCGAAGSIPPPAAGPSLLLRALFGAGGLSPGTGGAPPIGGAASFVGLLLTIGAERSLIWVTFFNLAPLLMSLSRAPCKTHQQHVSVGTNTKRSPSSSPGATYSSLDLLRSWSRG